MGSMSAVFPGMDPYLEAPGIWPGFHEAFLSYMRETIQPLLPENYYADIKTREEIGIAGCRAEKIRHSEQASATVPERIQVIEEEPLRVSFLEIRDAARDHVLATLIELLSPSNKTSGPDRDAFEQKQREVLSSQANWVQIDLQRSGDRVGCHPSIETHARRKGYHYLVTVSRAGRRSPALDLDLYGFTVRDPLPVISVPLLDPDPDVTLDLGVVFRRAYETGPYRKIIDYRAQPSPPLAGEEAAWARGIIG